MKNRKLYLLLVMMLMGALLLVACGGNTTEEPATEEPAAAVEEPAAAEPTEAPVEEPTEAPVEEPTEAPVEEPTEAPVVEEPEISITIWADDTRTPILQALAEEFQATYGVGLNVEQIADINDQFPIAAPAGEGPDILIGPHDRAGGWVASGLLAPIDLGDKASQFSQVALDGLTFDGQLYGLPYAVENMALFRNTDMVPDAPATWDDVIADGSALQASGDTTFGMALSGTTYDAFPIMTSFGGYVFGQDDAGNYDPSDVGIDGEGMIAAGTWIADNVASGFLSDNTDWDTAHVLFETGETPFLMAGPWALDRIRESGVPYAISNFPSGGQPFAGVQGFYVNALSENVLLAQTFLVEFVATEEVMTELQTTGNRASAMTAVAAASDDPDLAAFAEAGADATLMPAIPEMGSVWGSWSDAFSLIINGDQTPEEALANGAAQIRDLIGGAAAGMVNVPGSWQAASGACEGDWDPACEGSALTEVDGMYTASFSLPAGDYEVKVAHEGGWDENYGVDGKADGDNYAFSMAADGTVTFTYDPETHILEIATE